MNRAVSAYHRAMQVLDRAEEGTTRRRIMDAALELFAQHGYAGASMRMLARAAGLRESSLYNHFAGKDDFYNALIAQWGPAEFVQRLQSPEYRALADDPPAFFRLCGRHLVDRWIDPREHRYMAMISKEGPSGPGQQRFNQALYREEIQLLADYCAHFAQAHGLIAPDPRETARMFAAGLTLIRREHFTTSTELPPRPQVDAAVARFIDNFIGTVLR